MMVRSSVKKLSELKSLPRHGVGLFNALEAYKTS